MKRLNPHPSSPLLPTCYYSQQSPLMTPLDFRTTHLMLQSLIDERDNSIFGAIFEWDRSSAMADLVLIRPTGAPRAILALRGTLLQSPTIRRDIEDDLRFLAWESFNGSVRFNVAMGALRLSAEKYGSSNIYIAGHSLGAGFALRVGKALAKEGIYVETHLFNPPPVSLAVSLRNIGDKAEFAWKRFKSMLPSGDEEKADDKIVGSKSWIPSNLRERERESSLEILKSRVKFNEKIDGRGRIANNVNDRG